MFSSTSCVICGYSITDPVCNGCYINQTRLLLHDLKINSMVNDFIVDKLNKIFNLETLNDAECILCRKDSVATCRYCFSMTLIRILRELNFSEDLIANFKYDPISEEIPLENENTLDLEIKMK